MPQKLTKRPKIGDIFEVKLNDDSCAYLQYIANDMTQLNSDVVRVFKKRYKSSKQDTLHEIISDDVEFYAHVTGTIFGLKKKLWEKVGHLSDVGDLSKPLFRGTYDDGNPKIKKSKRWYVWRINEPMIDVGKLRGENQNADIGSALPPEWIIERMQTGEYQFSYPEF